MLVEKLVAALININMKANLTKKLDKLNITHNLQSLTI